MAYSFCLILAWTLVLLWTFIHRKAPTQDTCAHCQRSFCVAGIFIPAPDNLSSSASRTSYNHFLDRQHLARTILLPRNILSIILRTRANSIGTRSRGAHPNRSRRFAEGAIQIFFRCGQFAAASQRERISWRSIGLAKNCACRPAGHLRNPD